MNLLNMIRFYAILLLCAGAIADEHKDTKKEAQSPYSEAQRLVFSTPHLANIKDASTLYYDFYQSGSVTREFDDEITLTVTDISQDGGKDLEVSFLSGDNHRAYSDIKGFRSNPLIMFFLQWDVEKMDSGSKVTHHYYRHLLRQAFLTNAASEEIKLDFEGRSVVAHKVTFKPLAGRQDDESYKDYVRKHYEFILSDEVPGGIYSISTLIPSATATENDETSEKPIEYTLIRFNRIDKTS